MADAFLEDRLEELDSESQNFKTAVIAALDNLAINNAAVINTEDIEKIRKSIKPSLSTRQNSQRDALRSLFRNRPLILLTQMDAYSARERAAARAAEQRFQNDAAMRAAWNLQALHQPGVNGFPATSPEFYVPDNHIHYVNRACYQVDPLTHTVQDSPLQYEGEINLSDFSEFLHFRTNKQLNWNKSFEQVLPECFRLGFVDKHYCTLFRKMAQKYAPQVYSTIEFEPVLETIFNCLVTLESDIDIKLSLTLQLQGLTRKPQESIKNVLESYRSLKFQIESIEKPNQTLQQSKANAEKSTKQAAVHFVSPALKSELCKYVDGRSGRLTETDLQQIITFITRAEQTTPALRLENEARLSSQFVQLSCNVMQTRRARQETRSPAPHVELTRGNKSKPSGEWANQRTSKSYPRQQDWTKSREQRDGGRRSHEGQRSRDGGQGERSYRSPGRYDTQRRSRSLSRPGRTSTPGTRSPSPWTSRPPSQNSNGSRPPSLGRSSGRGTGRSQERPRSGTGTPHRSPSWNSSSQRNLPPEQRQQTPSYLRSRSPSGSGGGGAGRTGERTDRYSGPRNAPSYPQQQQQRQSQNGHTNRDQRSRHPPAGGSSGGSSGQQRGRSPYRGDGGGDGRRPYKQGRSPTLEPHKCALCYQNWHGMESCPYYSTKDFSRYMCHRCWAGRHRVEVCKGKPATRPKWASSEN